MKLLTAAALPILCVLSNATGLLGQDFDDYVFAWESFNGEISPVTSSGGGVTATTAGSKSEHHWTAQRLRCERLGQATPQSFRAAITILESRGCYSSGFPSDYGS